MKRAYTPYWEWEDWVNGMWGKSKNEETDLSRAIEFTGQWEIYGAGMGEVIEAWPRTMINTLSNVSVNRRAFLGHCAICFKLAIPEYITRQAWKHLTDQQRLDADAIATKHIKHWEIEYERSYRKIHKRLGTQMLLKWPS